MINRFLRWAKYKNRFNQWNIDEIWTDLFVTFVFGFVCFTILYYFEVITL